MISFHVKSVFTNVPLDVVNQIISVTDRNRTRTTIKNNEMFLESVKLCCDNFFNLKNNTHSSSSSYQWVVWCPHGYKQEHTIKNSKIKPRKLLKYIDDILCIIKKVNTETFLDRLSKFHNRLLFTTGKEDDMGILRFLDMGYWEY